MAKTVQIKVQDQDILATLRDFAQAVLKQEEINAILAPWRLPMKNMVMPTLLTNPEQVSGVDPLSPAFPLNGAKISQGR